MKKGNKILKTKKLGQRKHKGKTKEGKETVLACYTKIDVKQGKKRWVVEECPIFLFRKGARGERDKIM